MKELELAKKCLQEAIKTKDEVHRNNLIFQVALQLALFCKKMQEGAPEEQKKVFKKYERAFKTYAKIFKQIERRWLSENKT